MAYWTYHRGITSKGWKCSISSCKNNNQKPVTLTRPIQKLIPLEIMATESEVKLPADDVKHRKINIVADEPVIKQVLDEDVKEFINSHE